MTNKQANLTSEKREQDPAPALNVRALLRSFRFLGRWAPLVFLGNVLVAICAWSEIRMIGEVRVLLDLTDYTSPLRVLIGPILIYCLLNRICGGGQWMITNYATNRALENVRQRFFAKLQSLSKSFFDQHKAGWLVARNTGDMEVLGRFLTFSLMMLVVFLASVIFALWEVAGIAPTLLLPALVMFPFFVAMTILYKRRMLNVMRDTREQNSRIVANLSETIRGIRVVHAFNREEVNQAEFHSMTRNQRELEVGAARLNSLFMPSLDLMGVINLVTVVAFGSWLIQNNFITADGTPLSKGDLVAYFLLMNVILTPMRIMLDIFSLSIAASVNAERIFEVMNMEPTVADQPDAIAMPPVKGAISIQDLSFRYSEKDPWVFKNLDLQIPAGETLAIVGETGVGKTTLASLVARFYDPVEGAVAIDGHDLKSVTQESLHQQMGVVLQQGYLFTGTVLENLRFAKPHSSQDEVEAVAQKLGTHQSILALPEGYATQVHEGGDSLSLGQRQLISITRAVIADPKILILDEPTSSLDTLTERIIQKALDQIAHNRTTIVIAHRLSTVRNADRIIVFDKGRIVESGNHADLVASNGYYAAMVQKSAASGTALGMPEVNTKSEEDDS